MKPHNLPLTLLRAKYSGTLNLLPWCWIYCYINVFRSRYHIVIGASDCADNYIFSDVPTPVILVHK